jgi:hypothetical protein
MYNHQWLFSQKNVSPSFLHYSICHIPVHVSCCFCWCDLQTTLLIPTFYALACISCCHGQSNELIQTWHCVSWVYIETVMLIVFLVMASTYSALSCVCCWPSRTFFIQLTVQAFFKCLTNLFTLCIWNNHPNFAQAHFCFLQVGYTFTIKLPALQHVHNRGRVVNGIL